MAAESRTRTRGKALSLPVKDGSTDVPGRPNPHQNHLLDALPASDFERIAPHLELIPMKLGDVLYEPGAKLRHV